MYQICNKLFANRIIRIIISVLLVAVFFVVPIEHKMLEAEAAFTAAAAISVICAVLVAMGFTFLRVYLSDNIDTQFSKYSYANTVESLRRLAQDIWENCPGITAALMACFPDGNYTFETARQIVQIAPALYLLIKKYVMSKYGDSAEEIEDSVNVQYGIVGDPFLYQGYTFSRHGSAEPYELCSYSEICVADYRFFWELVSVSYDKYTYKAYYTTPDGIAHAVGNSTWTTKDPSSLSVVGEYVSINAPTDDVPFGSFKCYICWPYARYSDGLMQEGPFKGFTFEFTSYEEYQDALAAYAGETDPSKMQKTVDVDSKLFNESVSNLPQYVYIYENVEDYVGKTAADIAAPAYDEIYDSNVVDNTARTVTWQGDRTLCPIDELEGSLPAAVIGHWVATWDETSTLCNISCYAEDGTVSWSGEIATTLTWADVIAKLGDIAITGPIAGTIIGSAVGSIALPDTALDFDPLKIAGQTFSTKFPFCLPFDLYRAFKQFDYDTGGKAPVYEIPLNFGDTLGTHYIILDMAKWTPVANIVKWGVYISFMVSLIIVTKKVMGGS